MPQEFTTVSASSYDSASLATKLTEKSAEGWDVVGIVNTSTEVTAFLSRAAGSGSTTSTSSTSSSSFEPSSSSTSAPAASVSEPSGWGTAPASSTTPASSSDSSGSIYQPQSSQQVATPAAAQPAAAAATSTPSVPAGWYADPAGRFDLRYWDGGTWTEHVSRAGQQFTDPPVA
ncbi:MAG: hypothetical protein JWM12_3521 [Ilumatobacteraceae bacterium]|nr:hypothetical protein [Ilumatobacteraceae bacterium]